MKPVFSDAQEKELLDYISVIENILQGLTTRDVRYLAYHMAERSKIPHNFNKNTGLAGRDWLTRFKQRHPELMLSIPDVSLVSREKAFNRGNVAKIVNLAEHMLKMKNMQAHNFSSHNRGNFNTVQNDNTLLCKHDVFGDVGIAVKMRLDEDPSALASLPEVNTKSSIPKTVPTEDVHPLCRSDEGFFASPRDGPLRNLCSQQELLLPQQLNRSTPDTSTPCTQSDATTSTSPKPDVTLKDRTACAIKSEVGSCDTAGYTPLPLVPVVLIKEETPDQDSGSVCVKEEPLADALNEAGPDERDCSLNAVSTSLPETRRNNTEIGDGCPPPNTAWGQHSAGRLKGHRPAGGTTSRVVRAADLLSPRAEGCGGREEGCPPQSRGAETEGYSPREHSCASTGEVSIPVPLEAKSFQCFQCNFSTAYKGTLQRHIKVQHSTTKPYECPLCEYSCADKRYLKTHTIARHSDVRPFKCVQCDYSSTTNTHLKQHVMVKHLGVKPFRCSQCKFSSGNKSNLERHTLVKHSNITPFQCPDCDYSSYDKSNFKRHFLSKHPGLGLPHELVVGSKKSP